MAGLAGQGRLASGFRRPALFGIPGPGVWVGLWEAGDPAGWSGNSAALGPGRSNARLFTVSYFA